MDRIIQILQSVLSRCDTTLLSEPLAPLRIEPLESRLLLDGNIVAEVVGGTLVLTGDGLDNEVTISPGFVAGSLFLTPQGGTTVNGLAVATQATAVTRDIRIELGDGDDSVTLDGVAAPNSVRVVDTAGATTLHIDGGSVARDLIVAGPGQPDILLDGATVGGGINVTTDVAGCRLALVGSVVTRDVRVGQDAGLCWVTVVGGSVGRGIRVDGRAGTCFVRLVSGGVVADGQIRAECDGSVVFTCQGEVNSSVSLRAGGQCAVDLFGGAVISRDVQVRAGGDGAYIVDNSDIQGSLRVTHSGGDVELELLNTARVGRDVRFKCAAATEHNYRFDDSTVLNSVTLRHADARCNVTFDDDAVVGREVSINNRAGADTFDADGNSRFGSIRITNGDGGSESRLDDTVVNGRLDIRNGDGLDTLEITDSQFGSVRAGNGDGISVSRLDNTVVNERLEIRNGNGVDTLEISDSQCGSVRVDDGDGHTITDFTTSTVHGQMQLRCRNGFDTVDTQTLTVNGRTDMNFGDGGSTVQVDNSTFEGRVTIRSAGGDDTVRLDCLGLIDGPPTRFNDRLSIQSGNGDDEFQLGDGVFGRRVVCEGLVTLNGGNDHDVASLHVLDNTYNGGYRLTSIEAVAP